MLSTLRLKKKAVLLIFGLTIRLIMVPQNLITCSHAMIGKALKTILKLKWCKLILGKFYSSRK